MIRKDIKIVCSQQYILQSFARFHYCIGLVQHSIDLVMHPYKHIQYKYLLDVP